MGKKSILESGNDSDDYYRVYENQFYLYFLTYIAL